ncbi:MAG: ThuA domain-containing protein [Planctomycetota bacterium]|jgi:type 1 glutamine amidotransferase
MPKINMRNRPRRGAARALAAVALACLAAGLSSGAPAQSCGGFRVLVFSRTTGFRHDAQIKLGTTLIKSLGSANGFAVDATEDAKLFTASNLSQYAAVVFLNTTGDVLDANQQTAFENFVRRGGGLVGVHSAADTEYGWPFYGAALGAWFQSHPAIQSADVGVVNRTHPSTAHLPAKFSHRDEWYNFRTNPASNSNIRVLLTLDEKTYKGGTMGSVHPIAWYQLVGAGRSWYTGLGHDLATYSASFFHRHLLGGILFASGGQRQVTVTAAQPYGSGSGTPSVSLSARLLPSRVDFVVAGGGNGANALLLAGLCAATDRFGPYTLLVDARPGRFVALLPGRFDAAGNAVYALPLSAPIPTAAGTSLFFQGAQTTPTLGLSNGLRVTLTPR